MARKWKGYRPLVLNGRRFRWVCRFHYPIEVLSVGFATSGSTWPPDTVVVRPEDHPQSVLSVTWPPCSGPIVKPGFVRVCVEEAFRRGWLSEHMSLTLPGSEVPAPADQANQGLVEVVRDLLAGRQPSQPDVRKLD
jgi:hypothetical protein